VKPIISISFLLLSYPFLFQMTGCSGDDENVQNDSVIDQAVQKVADSGVGYIQTPIEKANAVKDIEEARHQQLKEQSP